MGSLITIRINLISFTIPTLALLKNALAFCQLDTWKWTVYKDLEANINELRKAWESDKGTFSILENLRKTQIFTGHPSQSG